MLKITAGAKRHFKDYKIVFWDPLSPALPKLPSPTLNGGWNMFNLFSWVTQ